MSDNTRQNGWNGVVKKCPNCGDVLSSVSAFCPNCGHELSARQCSDKVKYFSDEIQHHKDELAKAESAKVIKDILKKGDDDYYSEDAKSSAIQRRKEMMVNFISNFLIPNTVEDITELMLYAVENIQLEMTKPTEKGMFKDKTKLIVENAWLFFLDRCYCKAEFAFEGTKEFAKIDRIYKSIHKARKRADIQVWIAFFIMIMIAVGAGIGLRFAFGNIFGVIAARMIGIVVGVLLGWLEIRFIGPVCSSGNVKLE